MNDSIFGTSKSINDEVDYNKVYGIKSTLNTLAVHNGYFHGLDNGIAARSNTTALNMDLQENRFTEVVRSLRFIEGTDVGLNMNCNIFEQDRGDSFPIQQYGVYFEGGAALTGDIGGPGGIGNFPPAGNDWPVDSVLSDTVYPSHYVNDLSEYKAPENWYSFYFEGYDDTSTISIKYHRYFNEFLGEDSLNPSDDAVWPSNFVIVEPGEADAATCGALIPIIWPSQIKINPNLESGISNSILEPYIYPVPSSSFVIFKFPFPESGAIQIFNASGSKELIKNFTKIENRVLININSLKPGVYLAFIQCHSGKTYFRRIQKI